MARYHVVAHWDMAVDLEVEADSPEDAAQKVEQMWDNDTLPAGDWVPNSFEIAREAIEEIQAPDLTVSSLGEVEYGDLELGSINVVELAAQLGIDSAALTQEQINAAFDLEARLKLPPRQYTLVAETWRLQSKFTSSRFRFYGGIKDGTPYIKLETEFRYPVELDSPENQAFWRSLQQIMADTGAVEMDTMWEEIENSRTEHISGPEAGRVEYGPWHGKTCRQVGLWWDVLGMSEDQVAAKIEEVRLATDPIWVEAGVEVI